MYAFQTDFFSVSVLNSFSFLVVVAVYPEDCIDLSIKASFRLIQVLQNGSY
jgi:hypothetical protein